MVLKVNSRYVLFYRIINNNFYNENNLKGYKLKSIFKLKLLALKM